MRYSVLMVLIGLFGASRCPLVAQIPLTRADAEAAALARGARAAFARADTLAARGIERAARALPNPSLSAGYSKDPPQYHAALELPLDVPWLRSPRIGAARSSRDAARFGYAAERAAIRFEVDTAYTGALAVAARARLSRRTARDADSLLVMARLRRDAGDASELDVRLAAINAGQMANIAADDSLGAVEALLGLQLMMGLPGDDATIVLADSLAAGLASDSAAFPAGAPLSVAAAAAELTSAGRALTLAHRSVFLAPILQLGVEGGEPGSTDRRLLPTVGVALPLPLFNWNGGDVALARAMRDRAAARLELVRRETAAAVRQATRQLAAVRARLGRDTDLLASADRVAAMALEAYREGAVALPAVLEAQRNAREAMSRYIDDLAAGAVARATVRRLAAAPERP